MVSLRPDNIRSAPIEDVDAGIAAIGGDPALAVLATGFATVARETHRETGAAILDWNGAEFEPVDRHPAVTCVAPAGHFWVVRHLGHADDGSAAMLGCVPVDAAKGRGEWAVLAVGR